MLRLDKVLKPWKESASLNDHINLYGFWNETAFLTKSGDVGMILSVPGVDYESLDQREQEHAVKRLEAALKAFGPGFHVYQYLFKSNNPNIPFAKYDDPIVEAAIDQRRQFFEAKRDHLYQVEIFYAIVLEGPRSKSGVGAALTQLFRDPAGAIGELRTQFTNNSMKVLLRSQIEHELARLDQKVQAFTRQLADLMQIEALNRQGQLRFFRRLVNYDDWRIAGKPQSTQFLDYQVVNSNIEAERDHLRVGDHVVRVLTMKEAITETRPLVLDSLLKISANFYVVTEWTQLPADRARKEVNKRRRHFNMSKTSFVSQMGSDRTNPRDVLVDESKQSDIENLGDCLRALGDGQQLGDFSLTIVLYGRSKAELDPLVGEFMGVFTNADGNLFTETYNQLNAYFATVPGNYAMNLRKLYLLNTNYADLSFLFTILHGDTRNAHLHTEYLAVFETDNSTPYFLNLHNGEVAHTLILGMTGSGKSYLCNFLLQNAQKYAPLTFIFDIGSSFQSLTSIFGGAYLNVGQDSRDFRINPFSLAPTKENMQFLFSFFHVLMEGNDERHQLDFKEDRKLWDAIERVYVLEPDQRTLSNFGSIIGELKDRLHRWMRGGQYGFLFDNAEDTLSFSRFQTFNFAGWGDAPDVLEPLLFYVLHRASNKITDPKKLATFKLFLLDEAWLFIKNETIRNYIVQAQKMWRKHNAAMILATQSMKELEESGMLQIVSESWDATFSAPKSVSLTALVGGDDRVREAHRESVTTALEQLEYYTQARIGGNHPPETTGKFIAAKFEHDTARPVDGYVAPQLHTHAVVFNLTERENGQVRAIQPQSLFTSQQFATAIYQSELTYRLRQLGYEITAGRSGAPEIKGYTQEYLDASSPRSQQIREYMERTGRNGKEAAEIAAHSTRDRKEIHSLGEVMAAHRRLAAEYGHQADAVVRAARERAQHPTHEVNPQQRVRESVTFSRDKNFEREAVVDERAIVRDALRRGMGEITYTQVRGNLDARLASGEFQTVDRQHALGSRQLTTIRTIEAEREILRRVLEGRNQVQPVAVRAEAIQVADRHPHLNRAQKSVVEDVLSSPDRIQGIQGYAGTGKTLILATLRSAVEAQAYEVQGFAPTSRAAHQLREAGIEAGTLQGFLARTASSDATSERKYFYFVDELSLASTNQMQEFLARLRSTDRVLLIGDTRQHQGVEAGRPFEQLQEAGMRTAKLDEIVRQKDPALKSVVELLATGQTAAAIDRLRQQGRIREIADPQERIRAVAQNYAESPANTLIVSPDNASRRELNLAVRQELKASGAVAAEDHSFRVLVPRQDMTGAERAWANHYETGDVIRYARGSKSVGIAAGSYGTVVGINPTANLLTIEMQSGAVATYDPRRLTGVSVYREAAYEFAVGDRIQFTAPDRSLDVANRDLAVIECSAPDGRIGARLDNNRLIEFTAAEHRHFDHGYAVTSHSAQGLTAERVLIHADTGVHPDLLNSRFGYVSVSRASHEATVFTNDSAKLGQQLEAEINKTSALEMNRVGSPNQGIGIS